MKSPLSRSAGDGAGKAVLDWRELIDDKEIDAISTAAPSKVHAEIAIWRPKPASTFL